ncbi:VOC family protein [Hyphomicrobium sp. CS1GBMeth3]|uniref:VOC family protein n=1 Tax=Hyphomicrobium sp. CS1GBMeth3 TaxID=1892845 RepID=UPI000AD39001|nr:VOC family protein [Hyphomicrobium sp. CS1GBMeth3]
MTASSTLPAPNLMPLMRYRDLAEAMGWLEGAFGFEKQIAVSDSDGSVIYGQMTYRGSLMMMGAVRDTDLDKLMRQPDEVGGIETQSCYLVVDDADAHYARAQDAGAEIVLELKSDGLGRRGYSCRDPEGHIWNFGTYNPGKGLTMTVAAPLAAAEEEEPEDDIEPAPRRGHRMLMGIVGLIAAIGVAGWWMTPAGEGSLTQRIATIAGHQSAIEAERAYAELAKVRAEKRKAEEAAEASSAALETERARRLALETNSGSAVDKLAEQEHARKTAEKAIATLRDELERTQDELERAVEAKRIAEEKLAVKSAAQPAAPAPDAQSTAAASQQSMPAPSNIETSATRPAAEEISDRDEDDEAEARIPNQKADRPRARVVQKRRYVARKKLPNYVLDMRGVWPYESWSN